MSALGELNDLLKLIPVWRDLVTLPARVRALEEKLGVDAAITDDRPVCGFCRSGKLDLIDEKPDDMFGDVGVMRHTLKCSDAACGKTTTRQREP